MCPRRSPAVPCVLPGLVARYLTLAFYALFGLALFVLILMISVCPKAGETNASLFATFAVVSAYPHRRYVESEALAFVVILGAVVNDQMAQQNTNLALNAVTAIVCYLMLVYHWTLFLLASTAPLVAARKEIPYVVWVRCAALACLAAIDLVGVRNVWMCLFAFAEGSVDRMSEWKNFKRFLVVNGLLRATFAGLALGLMNWNASASTYAFVILFPSAIFLSACETVMIWTGLTK